MSTPSSAPREENDSSNQMQQARVRQLIRRRILIVLLVVLLLAGAFFVYRLVTTPDVPNQTVQRTVNKIEVVSTQEAMAQGLSGRDHIDRDAAMVFEFGMTGHHCMWMKDMKFAIDIVWLNESRNITAIEQNVAPDTYPKTFCHDGRTVVELAAGTVGRLPLYNGDPFKY